MNFKNSRLVTGLFLEAIVLCLIFSFSFIDIAATATLLIFNLFFRSLIIHLNGALNKKLGILSLGNIIGLLWNLVLHYFNIAGITFFGESFNLFFTIAYPFLNFMWIVSFWSLSLTILPQPRSNHTEVKT
jgi:hypothetical protein